jgi:bidirectional [NiFe] hydrogenase diaphorase subunit
LSKQPSDPAADERWRFIAASIKKFGARAEGLIEVLHVAQKHFGYLSRDVLGYISREMNIPPSKVFGVATFYNFFSLVPKGTHQCVVCMGTSCYLKGASFILHSLEQEMSIRAGQTTSSGDMTLSLARCVGDCGHAPLVILDEQAVTVSSVSSVLEQIRTLPLSPSLPEENT